jgi:hypothetical protein
VLPVACVMLSPGSVVRAKEIPRQEYLRYIPPGHPGLVQQTDATVRFHLYGDSRSPGYRDVDPVDGIDDQRHAVLKALAVRFAPHLVQNTSNMPVNFDHYIANRDTFPLIIDTWETTEEQPRLVATEEINLAALGNEACSPRRDGSTRTLPMVATRDPAIEDCKLLRALERFSPLNPQTMSAGETFLRARPEHTQVLFFDFPGEGPENWEKAYEPEYDSLPAALRRGFPHAYVHPFLVTARNGDDGSEAVEFVLQYWFYYPSNDGGNNHEGDWEHLNVVIAPRSRVEQPLSPETLEDILSGRLPATDDAADPLVIRRIEYYFHHFVMALDFSDPNVYLPHREWKRQVNQRSEERLREEQILEAIRQLAWVDDDETVINTHPIGYIGADNKGIDQALTKPGGKNRNSHGTFPFPGRYHNIGPAGATEQISLYVDPSRYWKKVRRSPDQKPVFKRGHVVDLAHPERLRIVPDWERLLDAIASDPAVRRQWSWMVLPIRWGYPATESPLAGILPHADTGNLAPHGPTYSSGWNVSGATPGFHRYEPHTLPAVFPLRAQDGFRNDLGFVNLTYPLLFNLPPLDFLSRLALYPVKWVFSRRDPVYYPKEGLPFRFVGVSSGVSFQRMSRDYNAMALNPTQYDEFLGRLLVYVAISGFDSTTVSTGGEEIFDDPVGPFLQVPFYVGEHFASENLVRNFRTRFGFRIDFNNIPSYAYSADLNYWEYAGSLRYSILTSWLQPFVKAGYGWSWYRVENAQSNGIPFNNPKSSWVKPEHIWPNVWHFGVGFEYIPWKKAGTFPGGVELALRGEYTLYTETLGLDLSSIDLERLGLVFKTLGEVPVGSRVTRHDLLLGLTVSF